MNQNCYKKGDRCLDRKNSSFNFLSFSLIVLACIFIALHYFGLDFFLTPFTIKANKQINLLVKAINNNNIEQISSILYLSNENTKERLNDKQLKMSINALNKPLAIDGESVSLREYLIKMEERSLLLIDEDSVILKSTNLLLSTNLPGVTIYLGETSAWESSSSEFYTTINPLPILPLQVTAKIEDTSYQNPDPIFIDPFKFNINSRPIINMNYRKRILNLSSSFDNALLYVNGTETEYSIQKESKEYGPIQLDQPQNTLFVLKEFPWGAIQSQKNNINITNQGNRYDFTLKPINQTLVDEIVTTIQSFNNEYSLAFNQLDPTYLTVTSTKMLDYVTKQIKDNYLTLNRKIKLTLESYSIDEKSITLSEENGSYSVQVLVHEQYSEAKWHQSQRMPAMKKNQPQRIRYTLIFDVQTHRWLINDWIILK